MLTEKIIMCLIICFIFIMLMTEFYIITFIDNKYIYISKKEYEELCQRVDAIKKENK